MTSWHDAISQAPDRKSLAALVNDYLAMWSPAEMARLPATCRPGRIRGVEDIAYWRQILSDNYCSGAVHVEDGGTLSRLIGFLTAAAERLGELDGDDGIEIDDAGAPPRKRPGDKQAQGE